MRGEMFMGPVAANLGGIAVYSYGLVVSAALLAGTALAWLMFRIGHRRFEPVVDILLWGIPLGILCGRAGYVLHHFAEFSGGIGEAFCFWQGGYSIYGAMCGFFLAVFGVCRVQGLDTWRMLDGLTPSLILSVVFAELGAFLLQLTMGTPFPADIPNDHTLAEYVEFAYRPMGFENSEYFEPIALYQAAMQVVAFFFVLLIACLQHFLHILRHNGFLFLFGAGLIAAIRFACGFFYLHGSAATGFTCGQVLSGGGAVILLIWSLLRLRYGEEDNV